MKYIIALVLSLMIFKFNAQSYVYSYTDPCTGVLKTITVPINGTITVSYYGEVGTFNGQDFQNGVFETWANEKLAQYENISPCAQIVGVATTINITQSTAINTLSILNSLSAIADMAGATNMLGGAVNTVNGSTNSENNNERNEDGNNTSNTGNIGNNGGSSTSINMGGSSSSQTSETTTETSTTSETSQATGEVTSETSTESTSTESQSQAGTTETSTSSEGTSEVTVETQEPKTTTEKTGSTNITAGSTNTIRGSTTTTGSPKSKNGNGAPAVIASADFVGFNFRDSEVTTGLKATGGYTALRWDGKRSWGGLLDYTSALKGPNATGFYAWIKPGRVTLLSGTLTVGFEGRGTIYGTISGGQMMSFKKVKNLKVVYMATVSYGAVYQTPFLGTAVIAGGMYDFKIGKRIDIKLMDLMVYSPYVSYYNDVVMKSPYVMIPSIGTNISITRKFKFNINAGGAWSLGQSTLNYTVTCGTRLLVGQ